MAKKFKDLAQACWKGYKAVGLKDKNGKKVPNCVPEEVETKDEVIAEADEVQTADYKVSASGRKVRAKHLIFHNQDDADGDGIPDEEEKDKKKKYVKEGKDMGLNEASYKGDGKVDTKKYSWGTMKTVHHGHEFSIPLHPEHHQAISKLKDEQEHKFKDETGRHWTARRKGDDVHFHAAQGNMKTKVAHSTMHEEVSLEESMADSWKSIQAMDKGSITGGKDQVKKRLDYLKAVHDHHKRFGNDTKKVRGEIEKINRSRLAEQSPSGTENGKLTGAKTDDNFKAWLAKRKAEKAALKKEETDLLEYEIHHDGHGNYRDDEGNEWSDNDRRRPRGSFARRHTITSDDGVAHSVHINGKKWKTFGSSQHAHNVANKIKGATVHKEEVEQVEEGIVKGAAEVVKQAVRVPYRAVKRVAGAVLDTAKDVGDAAANIKKKFKEETEMAEGYVVKYHDNKGNHKNTSRVFDDKAKADAHAAKGNGIDKVGGKYSVHKIDDEGRDIKEQVLDEARVEIDKDEYDRIKQQHKETAAANRYGNHANSLHVYQNEHGHVVNQTYAHHSHGLTTIEHVPETDKHYKYVKEDLDESVKTGNPGRGYHGEHESSQADSAYSKAHGMVKRAAGAAGHMKDVKKPNQMVTHYLDSVHGRHLKGNENDEYIAKDFGKFKKSYKPESFKEEQENTVKSYKEFVQSLNEYNSNKDGVYRHKGTYGGQSHDDDDDDEDDYGNKKPKAPAADAPKRGRGRPKGSSSGARQIGAATGKKKSGADYTGFKLHLPNTNK